MKSEIVGRLTRSLPLTRPPACPSMSLSARRLHSVKRRLKIGVRRGERPTILGTEFYPVVRQSASGEHRLPACPSRQLAETSCCIQSRPELVDRPQMLPASCRQLQAGSLRSPE